MKQIEGFDLISEAGELKKLPAGAYACKIIEVIDVPEKEYLDVYFDIAEGEYKGYFSALQANTGKNYGRISRSYKTNALPFFKAFITAIEKSNPSYKWDWNEKSLNDKFCAVAFRDEEYLSDGQIKVMAKADEIRSLQALRNNDIKIKPLKKYEGEMPVPSSAEEARNLGAIEIPDDELPF